MALVERRARRHRRLAACLTLAGSLALGTPYGRAAEPPPSAGWVETDSAGRAAAADLDQIRAVRADALNLRAGVGPTRPVVSVLRQGDAVRILGERATPSGTRWLRVEAAGGVTGWVVDSYVEPVRPSLDRLAAAVRLLGAAPAGGAAAQQAAATARRAPVERVKAGFVLSAPVGDAGWTYSHDQGRKALEELPFVEGTAYVESVPEQAGPVADAIDGLVAGGANLIFTTSFGYMDPTIEAAKRHPGVTFMHSAGFKTAENAGTYFAREYEGRYLAGMVAGGMTKTNTLGYVAAFPIAQVLRGVNAFTLGALAVNPDVEVRLLWTGNWFSPGLERETADRLLDGGADVLTMHQNSPAVVQAAAARGRYALGYHSDMGMFGPDTTLASVAWDWAPLYRKIAQDLHRGTWQPYQLWWGLKDGGVRLAGLSPKVPADLKGRIAAAEAAIKAGRLRIFEGTIRDNRGDVRVPARKVLTDAELLAMDFLVLGVKGEVPKPQAPAGPTD